MTDAREPTTFWRDWWRVARERVAQRLPDPFRSFLANGFALTLTFFLGGLLFGAAYILDEAEEYVAELLAALAALALVWPAIFLWYVLTAPAAMWRRDQSTIAALRVSLTPALKLTFDEACLRYTPRGRVTEAVSGRRFHDGEGSDRHELIKCINCSKATIEGVQVRMVNLKAPPPDEAYSPIPFTQFFHAVRLREFAEQADRTNLPPEAETFFCVLVQSNEYDPPRPNERDPRYHYEFLFTTGGTYEIEIEAHGQNTPVARAILIMELNEEVFRDDEGVTTLRKYEIVSVRQKDAD